MITTRGLTKTYRSITAVDRLDLDVRDGDIYGFLGANGSGKTTTVRMLLGLVHATSGSVEVLGQSMPAASGRVLPQVGAMIEGPAAYPHLSGRRNLTLFDAMGAGGRRSSRARRVDDALDQVGLGGVDDRGVGTYSLGMRQRLGIAQALMRAPRLLVLDEPTNGLDPQGIREIRALLLALHAAGTTVFVSSHLLTEMEQLCTRVGILDQGRLVIQEELADVRRPTGRIVLDTPHAEVVRGLVGDRLVEVDGTRVVVLGTDAGDLAALLVGAGVRLDGLVAERQTLEDVVLAATSEGTDRMVRG